MQDQLNHPMLSATEIPVQMQQIKQFAPLALTLLGALSLWNHKFLILGAGALYYFTQKKG